MFEIRPLVSAKGLEPLHLAIPEPKSGVSANFTKLTKHSYKINLPPSIIPGCNGQMYGLIWL